MRRFFLFIVLTGITVFAFQYVDAYSWEGETTAGEAFLYQCMEEARDDFETRLGDVPLSELNSMWETNSTYSCSSAEDIDCSRCDIFMEGGTPRLTTCTLVVHGVTMSCSQIDDPQLLYLKRVQCVVD